MNKTKTCRNYLLVKNSVSDNIDELNNYLENMYNESKCRYIVGQIERGEKTGRFHYQIFINFSMPVRPSILKKIDNEIHWNYVYRNNGADDYCMKVKTRIAGPIEFGFKPVRRNSKVDWANVKLLAQSGQLDKIDPKLYITHYSNLTRIAKDHLTLTNSNHLRGIWIYGEAGCGKSKWVRDNCPDLYPKLLNKWWDGYTGQKFVVMDDMDPEHNMLCQQIKLWSDRYGVILETKGGAVADKYEWFIVTSQYYISEVFTDSRSFDAISRRFLEFNLIDIIDKNFNEVIDQSDSLKHFN